MSSLTDLFLPVPDDYAAGVASGANAVDAEAWDDNHQLVQKPGSERTMKK